MIKSAVISLVVCGVCLLLATAGFGADAQKGKPSKQKSDAVSEQPTQKSASGLAAGEEINWLVVSKGGTQGSSTNYNLGVTVGQTAAGYGTSTNYGLNLGFWQDFGCCQNRGNVDGQINPIIGPIDVADLTYLVAFLFRGGDPPPCEEEGNVDGVVGASGPIDVADLTYLVAYLFRGGPVPPPCP